MSRSYPTPDTAAILSAKLVEAAIAHLTTYLTDQTWMAAHRRVGNQVDYATWTVCGCNRLTMTEMGQVREALRAAGWRTVVVAPRFHDASANWEVTLTFTPSEKY